MDASATWDVSCPSTFRTFCVRRRVILSTSIFTAAIAAQLLEGMEPYSWSRLEHFGIVGASLVVLGLLIRSWSAGIITKDKALTTTGPYSLCRHPLYFGTFLMAAGYLLVIGSWPCCFAMVPFLMIYRFTIDAEEQRMERRYGSHWRSFAHSTPRFLPWQLRNYATAVWSFNKWLKAREYRAAAVGLLGLAAIEFRQILG